MTISKNMLVNLPKEVNVKVEHTIDLKLQELISENGYLRSQIDVLTKQVEVIAEFEKTLLNAFNEEITMLEDVRDISPSKEEKYVSLHIRNALNRIKNRWNDGAKYHINKKNMSIDKT
jgi:hypothetical protein